MMRLCLLLVFVLPLCLANAARGGEAITERFQASPGVERGQEVLPGLQNKGLIAEFLDPGDTGLGKSLGYLIWREVLTAISDQAGAGVVLAHPPGDKRIVDLLETNYHLAAADIARNQKCPMLLWGAVWEQGNRIYVHTYITLLPEIRGSNLLVRLRPIDGLEADGLEAEIPRTRYNFALVETSREVLFKRTLVTRKVAVLRQSPNRAAPIVARLPVDKALSAVDMQAGWFEVKTGDGATAYIEHDSVAVPPAMVKASGEKVTVRSGPGKNFPAAGSRVLDGSYRVLDMRYRPQQGLWYCLDIEGRPAWVAGWLVQPLFSLPAIHFMAGLYRYRAQNYNAAANEFTQFLNAAAPEENVNRATAYQLRGASYLFSRNKGAGLYDFQKAVELTPYDPFAYNLLALAKIDRLYLYPAVLDLQKSLSLDQQNERTVNLIKVFYEGYRQGKIREYSIRDRDSRVEVLLNELIR